MFKHIGYFMFSILGMAFIKLVFFEENLLDYLSSKLFSGILIFFIGQYSLGLSFEVLKELDIDLSNNEE